jgi:hypothetical protein
MSSDFKYDLLANFQDSDFSADPFPHLCIKNCLPEEAYLKLEASFPDFNKCFDGLHTKNNQVFALPYKKVLGKEFNEGVSDEWDAFLDYQSSPELISQVIGIFYKNLAHKGKKYHYLKEMLDSLEENIKTQTKFDGVSPTGFTNAIPSININTVPTTDSVTRSIHLDRSKNIYGGLLYFRSSEDVDNGGNFELYKWNTENDFLKRCYYESTVSGKHATLSKTVPYEKNTLVLFLNTIDALHAVSERKRDAPFRRYTYVGADSPTLNVVNKSNLSVKVARKVMKLVGLR